METCTTCGDEAYGVTLYPVQHDDGETEYYCQKCIDKVEGISYCESCDTYYYDDDAITPDNTTDMYLCPRCGGSEIYTCEGCGVIIHRETASNVCENHCEQDLCESCFSNAYTYCDSCGDAVNNDYAYYYDGGVYCCESCAPYDDDDDDDDNDETIHRYEYTPSPSWYHTPEETTPRRLYFGIELEVEIDGNCRDVAEHITENHPGIYCKYDCSINHGFEIVTHPMTFDYHKAYDWRGLLSYVSSHGGTSHDTTTCGIHVHTSRYLMSVSHAVKYGMFIHGHERELSIIARRDPHEWGRFKNVKGRLFDTRDGATANGRRYEAINWQNPKTVELRIFRGTLKPETFMSCIELAHALYYFTELKPSPLVADVEKSWGAFVAYVHENKKQYGNLLSSFPELFTKEVPACV